MNDIFLKRMKTFLNDEYEAYEQSLSLPAYKGLRVNTSKINVDDFLKLDIVSCRPSKICPQSFYLPSDISGLGNHPAHLAGLFYMQEPSASSAVEILDVQANDWVLDMCSAPGGKSSQIASKLNHHGFLVSNEIEWKRASVLMSNMERLGFSHNMVVSGHPSDIEKEFGACFDKVLVDAPCSGEGMFKKHLSASNDWSVEHVQACAKRQLNILDNAYGCLKEDGILVYSTCTYAPEENEMVVCEFLKRYPDMELIPCNVSFGRSGFQGYGIDAQKVCRIFPMDEGEGHFVAKFKKHGSSKQVKLKYEDSKKIDPIITKFLKQQLSIMPKYIYQKEDKVYLSEVTIPKLKKVKVLRAGILLGELVKGRIEPHQHFYVSSYLSPYLLHKVTLDDQQINDFLKGYPLNITYPKGYVALCYKDYVIGYGKSDGMVIKNKYPKGMRLKG